MLKTRLQEELLVFREITAKRLGQAPITESLFLASMRKTKRVFFPVAIGIAQ